METVKIIFSVSCLFASLIFLRAIFKDGNSRLLLNIIASTLAIPTMVTNIVEEKFIFISIIGLVAFVTIIISHATLLYKSAKDAEEEVKKLRAYNELLEEQIDEPLEE